MRLYVWGAARPVARHLKSPLVGIVVSVYARAVNLRAPDGSLVVLHGTELPWTPFSLRVSSTPSPGSWHPDPARWAVGLPLRRDEVVTTPELELWEPGLAAGPDGTGAALGADVVAALIREELARSGRGSAARALLGRRADGSPATVSALRGAIEAVRQALGGSGGEQVEGRVQDSVSRLVGLGEGLTPSGDDLLVGVLAGLTRLAGEGGNAWARRQLPAWRAAVRRALARGPGVTTDVSREFLRHAAAGRFAEPLKELVVSVRPSLSVGLRGAGGVSGDAREQALAVARQLIRRALAVGASSGADGLAGLLLVLEAALEAKRNRCYARGGSGLGLKKGS